MKISLGKSIPDEVYAVVCSDNTIHDDRNYSSYSSSGYVIKKRIQRLDKETVCGPHRRVVFTHTRSEIDD